MCTVLYHAVRDRLGRILSRCRCIMTDTRGIGVVEVILILVGLVIIFKSQLTSLVETIFQKITSESATI